MSPPVRSVSAPVTGSCSFCLWLPDQPSLLPERPRLPTEANTLEISGKCLYTQKILKHAIARGHKGALTCSHYPEVPEEVNPSLCVLGSEG